MKFTSISTIHSENAREAPARVAWQPRGGSPLPSPTLSMQGLHLSSGSWPRGPADLPLSPSTPAPGALYLLLGSPPMGYTLLRDRGASGKGEEPPGGLEPLDPSCLLALYYLRQPYQPYRGEVAGLLAWAWRGAPLPASSQGLGAQTRSPSSRGPAGR